MAQDSEGFELTLEIVIKEGSLHVIAGGEAIPFLGPKKRKE